MSKPSFTTFTDADFLRLAQELQRGDTAVLPGMSGAPAGDFAEALMRLGRLIGNMSIKMRTVNGDLHITRKMAK